jgi:hypothetical protein
MHHHWQHAAVKQTNVLFLFSRHVIFLMFSFYFSILEMVQKRSLLVIVG